MKHKIFLNILACSLLFISCKKEVVGGKCTYATVEREMVVTFIDGDLNDKFMISFQQKDSSGDDVYRLNNKELKSVFRNFDSKEFNNKGNSFLMTFEEITQGSCVPFVIKKVSLNN